MALGRRKKERQQEMWVETAVLPRSDGHVFYCKLNRLLAAAGFDEFVESLCEEHYHNTMGRPGIPPGKYFRMLLVGYFEGIGSQRGIAWRCADSLSLRAFLDVPLAYKAEHVIDLDTELILAAEIYPANKADVDTIGPSITAAQDNLIQADSGANPQEAVADKGYDKNETLAELEFTEGLRTYIAEPKQTHRRNWKNKPDEYRQAVTNNRRRTKGNRGRSLQRKRSERVERSFAHVCGTGGARRTWLRGIDKVRKRYLISAFSRNLGLVMRSLFGIGTARSLQAKGDLADSLQIALFAMRRVPRRLSAIRFVHLAPRNETAPTANRSVLAT